ncbi:MAG: cytochrome c oxidase subunit II, partial [Actinomycetota bacterium]
MSEQTPVPTLGQSRTPIWLAVLLSLLAAGCGGDPPSVIEPVSGDAERIGRLWWVMLAISAVVFAVVLWLLIGSIIRRRRDPAGSRGEGIGRPLILWGGLIGPTVVLVGVFLLATFDLRALSESGDPSVEVVVSGEQWWWEVRYPETEAVTANEIHVPAGEEILFRLESGDVIHSFWVPQAGPKRDMIPGQPNELVLSFDDPGVYRGVCAEFCGLQHAKMQLSVVAQPRP